MKKIGIILFFALSAILTSLPQATDAQCSMCRAAAKNGAMSKDKPVGKGLNNGILLLLGFPYAAAMVVGVLWYRNSKFEKVKRIKY